MKTTWKQRLTSGTLALGIALGGGATVAAPAHAGQIAITTNHTVTGKTAKECQAKLNYWMQKTIADPMKWNVKKKSSCTWKARNKYEGTYSYKKFIWT